MLIRDYLRTLSEALEDFRMDLSNPFKIDEVVMESINNFIAYRNDFIDLASFCASFINSEDIYDEFFYFFERIIPYLFRTAAMQSWKQLAFDNYKFIAYELFLYYAAILLRERRFNTIDKLLSKQFHYTGTAPEEKGKSWDYSVFCKYVSALEELRKARLGLRVFSCTGEIIKERADRRDFDFERLMEVDYILFVRSVLHLDYSSGRPFSPYWFPRCLPYADDHNSFTFILRAVHKEHFQNLATVLGVNDKDDLLRRWSLVRQNLQLNHVGGDWINPETLLCLNKLDTQ
ncbi:MAG: hypothetical protein JWQ98_1041 [Chlorobi bacterium]|nr:hypothetical protein [Chlorobiota bacterium]